MSKNYKIVQKPSALELPLAPIGSFRVRVIQPLFDHDPHKMDVREFVSTEDYEGFGKRGVRLDVEQLIQLHSRITEALVLIGTKTKNEAEKAQVDAWLEEQTR